MRTKTQLMRAALAHGCSSIDLEHLRETLDRVSARELRRWTKRRGGARLLTVAAQVWMVVRELLRLFEVTKAAPPVRRRPRANTAT